MHVCAICRYELSEAYKLKKKFEDTSKKLLLLKSQHQNVYYNDNNHNYTIKKQEHHKSGDLYDYVYKQEIINSQIENNTNTNNGNNTNGKTTMVKMNYKKNDIGSLNSVIKINNMYLNNDEKLYDNVKKESKDQLTDNEHNILSSNENITLLNSQQENHKIINKSKENSSILINEPIETTNDPNSNLTKKKISSPLLKRKCKNNFKRGKLSVPITTEKWDAEDNVIISKLQSKVENKHNDINKTQNEIQLLLNKVNEVNKNKNNNQRQFNQQNQQRVTCIQNSTDSIDIDKDKNKPIIIPTVNEIDAVSFVSNENFLKFIESDESKKLSAYRKRKHPCLVCGKRFAGKSNLVDHLRFHANVRPFKCTYCDKTFIQSASLKSHTRVHTRERPYTCHVCEKAFSQSSALKIHIRTHTNERLFKCTICSKAFISQSDLSKHKRIHDLIKKFQCVVCNRGFAQKCNLQKHQSLMHPKVSIADFNKIKMDNEVNK